MIKEFDPLPFLFGKEMEKPVCRYGALCYRKNPDHLKAFSHGDTEDKPVDLGESPIIVRGRVISTPAQYRAHP